MSKLHANGHMIKQDWLDRETLRQAQVAMQNERQKSKFFYLTVELPQIKCDDTKYIVLYYEEDADTIIQTIPANDIFVVNDPELELVTDTCVSLFLIVSRMNGPALTLFCVLLI